MKKIKKVLLLILALAMSATLFVACNQHTHDYTELKHDENSHWYECVCGDKDESSVETHKGGTATCTKEAECEVCGQTYGDVANHNYTELKHDENSHWYECVCGDKDESSVETHKGGTATCTDKAKCEVCGQKYGEKNADNHASSKYKSEKNADGTYNECYACCGKVVRENIKTETKTYTVNNGVSNVTCSDDNVTLSMPTGAEGQLFLNDSFAGTPITLTFTLPHTYVILTGVSVQNVWTGGRESVSAWIGETYNASAIFINGAMGWSGWTNVGYQSTFANIAAAGYESSGNQVSITVQPSGGDQVVLLNLTFTYEVAI